MTTTTTIEHREWPAGIWKNSRRRSGWKVYPGNMPPASEVIPSRPAPASVDVEPVFAGFTGMFRAKFAGGPCNRCDERTEVDQWLRYERWHGAPDKIIHNRCLDLQEWSHTVLRKGLVGESRRQSQGGSRALA